MPTKRLHDVPLVKGSHVAVQKRPCSTSKGWEAIAHPTPEKRGRSAGEPPPRPAPRRAGPKYVGVDACGACHKGPTMGHQFSRWRHEPARAGLGGALATPRPREIAREEGRDGRPAEGGRSVSKCHATGAVPGRRASRRPSTVARRRRAARPATAPAASTARGRDARQAGGAAGRLEPVTAEDLPGCHENAHGKPFDLRRRRSRRRSPTPK